MSHWNSPQAFISSCPHHDGITVTCSIAFVDLLARLPLDTVQPRRHGVHRNEPQPRVAPKHLRQRPNEPCAISPRHCRPHHRVVSGLASMAPGCTDKAMVLMVKDGYRLWCNELLVVRVSVTELFFNRGLQCVNVFSRTCSQFFPGPRSNGFTCTTSEKRGEKPDSPGGMASSSAHLVLLGGVAFSYIFDGRQILQHKHVVKSSVTSQYDGYC